MSAATATAPLNQDSIRYSTYSGAPSLHPSIAPTVGSNGSQNNMTVPSAEMKEKHAPVITRSASTSSSALDPRSAEIKEWAASFERISDQRLEQQRFVPSGEKSDEISTNALGAKLERALGRRMSTQDADHRKSKEIDEKAVAPAAQ